MKTSEILNLLAQGINPDTGEQLTPESVAQSPECIRMLSLLAGELGTSGEPLPEGEIPPEGEQQRTPYAITCQLQRAKEGKKQGDPPPEEDADDVGPLSEVSCTICGTLIPLARLEVLPETKVCAPCSEDFPDDDKPRAPEGFGGSREDTARLRRGYLGDGR